MTTLPTDHQTLRRLDLAHHLPAQQNYRLMEQLGGSRIIARAKGSRIYDADGRALLDGMAGLWCVNVGYGREELARAAYEQMLRAALLQYLLQDGDGARRVARDAAGEAHRRRAHAFLLQQFRLGSERHGSASRAPLLGVVGQPKRKIFISRWNAYHGSTVAGASLGGMKYMHAQGGLPIPGIEHVMQPYWFGEGFGESTRKPLRSARRMRIEERILAVGPENVAAFIGEPVQGAGGVIIPPPGYWPRVEAICRRHGILLICDEVICGFGRLGRWFGHQHFGVTPDIVTMAKGLSSGYAPISATAVSARIVEALKETNDEFAHGFTYSGHPTAAAVALKNIEIIEREGLVRARRNGPRARISLQALRALGGPRAGGRGALAGI